MDYLWRKHSKFTTISGGVNLTYFCNMCKATVLMSVGLTAAIIYACNYTFFFSCKLILFPYSHEVTVQQCHCHKLMEHNEDMIGKKPWAENHSIFKGDQEKV